jgi:WXG100 family type VII secretion target
MANVQVNYEQLQQSANRLRAAQQDIETRLAQLRAMIDGLVQSDFKTDLASGKFQQSYAQWTTGAKQVIAGLDGMTTFLNTVVKQHQSLDSQLSQTLND